MRDPALARLDRERVARGVCRHCGGPVPCLSVFGDYTIGRRHTWPSYSRTVRRHLREAKR